MKFSVREYDAVLAGLRLLQWELEKDTLKHAGASSRLGAIREIYRDSGAGLSAEEIDALCEKINA